MYSSTSLLLLYVHRPQYYSLSSSDYVVPSPPVRVERLSTSWRSSSPFFVPRACLFLPLGDTVTEDLLSQRKLRGVKRNSETSWIVRVGKRSDDTFSFQCCPLAVLRKRGCIIVLYVLPSPISSFVVPEGYVPMPQQARP